MGVSREQLYKEVWDEPMLSVAKRYGVSSSFLGRVCERLDVPRPARGYWAQRAVGIKLKRPALPAAAPGSLLEWVRDGAEPLRQSLSASLPQGTTTRAHPSRHPLLDGARAHFDHARESRDETYVRPYKYKLVDVIVSKPLLQRALDVASALFLFLEERGQRVLLASAAEYRRSGPELRAQGKDRNDRDHSSGPWSSSDPTVTVVGKAAIGLTIFEPSEYIEVRYDTKLQKWVPFTPIAADAAPKRGRRYVPPPPREWTSHQWIPNGRLAVRAYAPHSGVDWERYWRETSEVDIASFFETIAEEVARAAPTVAKRRLEYVEERRIADEEQRRKWEISRREAEETDAARRAAEREAGREKSLLDEIQRWRTARDVRAYVDEIHALVRGADLEITEGGKGDDELKWALGYAERIDPLTSWRKDIERTKAEAAGLPCSKCGKVHGVPERPEPNDKGHTDSAAGVDDKE